MIEAKHLYYKYDDKYVLKDINLQISDNDSLAILGANGSGKTTLLKCLMGILKPTKGDVLIDGVNTRKLKINNIFLKIGYVPQNPIEMFFSSTVEDEIGFILKNAGYRINEMKLRVNNIMGYFNINHLRGRSPFEISGGEQKIISIASIVVLGQKYLFLDEPTNSVDYKTFKKIVKFIREYISSGKTVIIATHDVTLARVMKRFIALKDGKIYSRGYIDKLYDSYFLKSINVRPLVLLDEKE